MHIYKISLEIKLDNKKTLHDIIGDYQNIESRIIENDGELDSSLEELLKLNNVELKDKLDGYEKFTRYLMNQVEFLKDMESHYSKRRKILEKLVKRNRDSMLNALKITGDKSIKTKEFNFNIIKTERWTVNDDALNEDIKNSLISEGLAEELFKPSISKIKDKSKEEGAVPEWIDIEDSEYIKVS